MVEWTKIAIYLFQAIMFLNCLKLSIDETREFRIRLLISRVSWYDSWKNLMIYQDAVSLCWILFCLFNDMSWYVPLYFLYRWAMLLLMIIMIILARLSTGGPMVWFRIPPIKSLELPVTLVLPCIHRVNVPRPWILQKQSREILIHIAFSHVLVMTLHHWGAT